MGGAVIKGCRSPIPQEQNENSKICARHSALAPPAGSCLQEKHTIQTLQTLTKHELCGGLPTLQVQQYTVLLGESLGKGTFGVVFNGYTEAPASPSSANLRASYTCPNDEESQPTRPPSEFHMVPRWDRPGIQSTQSLDYEATVRSLKQKAFSDARLGEAFSDADAPKRREVAVKFIEAERLAKLGGLKAIEREMQILRELQGHAAITSIESVFQLAGDRTVIIVMQKAGAHHLSSLLSESRKSEKFCRRLAFSLFDALAFIHSKSIAHRDIKLENLLLEDPKDPRTLRVIDFGLARKISSSRPRLSGIAGTWEYMAPEVAQFKQKCVQYGVGCDVWSAAVTLFILLGRRFPFPKDNGSIETLIKSIAQGEPEFDCEAFGNVSDLAKEFLKSLFIVEPHDRPTAKKTLEHEWFRRSRRDPSRSKREEASG